MKLKTKSEISMNNNTEGRRYADWFTKKVRKTGGKVKRVEDEMSITLIVQIDCNTPKAPDTHRPLAMFRVGV